MGAAPDAWNLPFPGSRGTGLLLPVNWFRGERSGSSVFGPDTWRKFFVILKWSFPFSTSGAIMPLIEY